MITNGGAWVFIVFLFIFSMILGIAAQEEKKGKEKASTGKYMA